MDRTIAVVVLGVSETASQELVKSIRSDAMDELSWRIVNRYYDATVTFRLFEEASIENDEQLALMHQSPALVVLVDPAKTLSSSTLDRLNALETDVSLVVGISGPGQLSTAKREQWDDLCLENGFEFVELDQKRPEDDNEGLIGIERVREALQAHAWPSSSSTPRASQIHPSSGFNDDFAPFVTAPSDESNEERIKSMHDFLFQKNGKSLAPDEFPDDDGSERNFDLSSTLDQLRTLKLRADAIEDEDARRDFAETIALAFASHLE